MAEKTPEDHLAEAWAYVDETVVSFAEASTITGISEVLVRSALETGLLQSLRKCDVMLYRDRQRAIAADLVEIYVVLSELDDDSGTSSRS